MIFKTFIQPARYSRFFITALIFLAGTAYAQSAADLYDQMKTGRCEPAFNNLLAGAQSGSPLHMFFLGNAYGFGHCTLKNPQQAVTWFRKAAEQGLVSAQFNLGVAYGSGDGVTQDFREAVTWFRKAAEQGDADAQFNLGIAYDNGDGVAQDAREAVSWYRKAAEQGFASAQNSLGVMYKQGAGVQQDAAEAVRWYEMAARQGNAWGQRNLALMLRDGSGVQSDPVQAHAWFNLSASADDPHPNAAKERDALATTLSPAHVAEAKRLAREWKLGKPIGLSRLKPPVPVKASATPAPVAQGPYPGQPAKRPGVTSCNTNCTNGDCYRTYDNGRKTHFQAKRRFNPFNSEWEYDSGSC